MENKHESPPAKRRRASRAGQERRFECKHPGCEKRYSRAEHLQRHELNHAPKHIYRCELPQCGLTFVRADLYARHKARHDGRSLSTPREREAASSANKVRSDQSEVSDRVEAAAASEHDAETVPRGESSNEQPRWSNLQLTQTSPASISQAPTGGSISAPGVDYDPISWPTNNDVPAQTNDNFAAWLFESPNSHDGGFHLDNGPFLDFGLDYSPNDIWNAGDFGPLTIDYQSAPHEPAKGSISEQRRAEITLQLSQFLGKQRSPRLNPGQGHVLSMAEQFFPKLTSELLDKFVSNYWNFVSGQMSIVHQPTFSSNSCHLLLLLAIISLGAADLVKSQPKGALVEYKELADLIMSNLRWEIFTDADAEPPVQLWVAQTLLLLELYEKQWSTRRLHERAHIHHASTLTLLRRGSPLVGRSEDETPPSETPTRFPSPVEPGNGHRVQKQAVDTWWVHWVRNESFNRVVFAAFFMDTLHALLYGHAADMAPYEIRTNLPCDDSLWTAKSADEVRRLDGNLKMYGVRSFPFLEGLKQSLHAQHVQTHSEARMLLMSGLLSVGWHVNRREKHLQFLETAPSNREQGRWRSLLLNAFSHWRTSFEAAVGVRSNVVGSVSQDTDAATVLFHLAHMTMHADIIGKKSYAIHRTCLTFAYRLPDLLWIYSFTRKKSLKSGTHPLLAVSAYANSSQCRTI